jgi:hypothetical protein
MPELKMTRLLAAVGPAAELEERREDHADGKC